MSTNNSVTVCYFVFTTAYKKTDPVKTPHQGKRQFVQIIRQNFSQQNCPSYMIDVACDTERLNARRTRSCKSADLLSLFDTLSLQYWLHDFCRRRRCRQQRHRSSSVCACAAYPQCVLFTVTFVYLSVFTFTDAHAHNSDSLGWLVPRFDTNHVCRGIGKGDSRYCN